MIWIVQEKASHEAISCNLHETPDGVFQVWIERPNGKSLKLLESRNKQEAVDVKECIDFAVKNGDKVVEL